MKTLKHRTSFLNKTIKLRGGEGEGEGQEAQVPQTQEQVEPVTANPEEIVAPVSAPVSEEVVAPVEEEVVAPVEEEVAPVSEAPALEPLEEETMVAPVEAPVTEEPSVVPVVEPLEAPEVAPTTTTATVTTTQQPPDAITVTLDKTTLETLIQNLNTNILVNTVAYANVLNKLIEHETNETKKAVLNKNIQAVQQLQNTVSSLLNDVQTDLDIPDNKRVNPETVIEQASSTGTSSFMQNLLGAQSAAIIGALTAAAVLMGGSPKKHTRRMRSDKGFKKTRRA
jgi:hypothetical protein